MHVDVTEQRVLQCHRRLSSSQSDWLIRRVTPSSPPTVIINPWKQHDSSRKKCNFKITGRYIWTQILTSQNVADYMTF